MKGFFNLFRESARELTNVRTITTTGLLMAVGVVLRFFSLQITTDVRVTFSFIAIAIIGMLFGPVVAGMAGFGVDFIGFLFDKTGNPYYPPLALVAISCGVIYGIFLYQKGNQTSKIVIMSCIARVLIVVFCNLLFNSYLVYTGFVNPNFSLFATDGWDAFLTWLFASSRLLKNIAQLPIDLVLLGVILPIAERAYRQVSNSFKRGAIPNNSH